MEKRKNQIFGVLMIILITAASVIVYIQLTNASDSDMVGYTTHEHIRIESDAEFISQGFPGNGTAENPFLIEGYYITAKYHKCIYISETNFHFIIRDCLLKGDSNSEGITLYEVPPTKIFNNTIVEGNEGIKISSAPNSSIVNNTIRCESIAVKVSHSPNSTLGSNIMIGGGLTIRGSPEDWTLNVSADNMVNGKPLKYIGNLSGLTIDGTQYGQVIIVNCTYVTLENGIFYDLAKGITLAYSSFCNVINNTVVGNLETDYQYGIYSYHSLNSTIIHNSISNITRGITLYESHNATIMHNTISDNEYHGIYIDSTWNTTIANNIISRNKIGVYVYYGGNERITMNTLTENGLYFFDYSAISYPLSIDSDNLVNGKPFGYFRDLTNTIIDGSQYGQVVLVNCTQVTVENGDFRNATVGVNLVQSSFCSLNNNSITRNSLWGIKVYKSTNNTIYNNSVSENKDGIQLYSSDDNILDTNTILENRDGIQLYYSDDNILETNTILENVIGVYLERSDGNIVASNTIAGNSEHGAEIRSSEENHIYLNIFDNEDNVREWGGTNHWNTTGRGNYWSDYSGDGVYEISQQTNSTDYFPYLYESTLEEDIGDLTPAIVLWALAIGMIVIVIVVMKIPDSKLQEL